MTSTSATRVMQFELMLNDDDRREVFDIVVNAAIRRYVIHSASPDGDLSINLDMVATDMPDVLREIVAIVDRRRDELNDVVPRG